MTQYCLLSEQSGEAETSKIPCFKLDVSTVYPVYGSIGQQ